MLSKVALVGSRNYAYCVFLVHHLVSNFKTSQGRIFCSRKLTFYAHGRKFDEDHLQIFLAIILTIKHYYITEQRLHS